MWRIVKGREVKGEYKIIVTFPYMGSATYSFNNRESAEDFLEVQEQEILNSGWKIIEYDYMYGYIYYDIVAGVVVYGDVVLYKD